MGEMSKLVWCPNCKQNVASQDLKGVSAAAPLVLILIGLFLLFIFWPLGLVVLLAGGIVAVVRIIEAIAASGKSKIYCPICKATELFEARE